jgi:glyoxylase-like metal-dependent hydrolase (beta-lactamase superfamily II)
MKIGKYKLTLLNTGTFGLDGGAMFGIIPKPLWQKNTPADDKNRITLGARCLLLESDSKKILVETGIGDSWDEKFKVIYNVDFSENTLSQSLAGLGLKNEDITDVILTHLHFDHTGGSTKLENEKFIPSFPNAKFYVQKEQFNWAENPNNRDKGSFIPHTFMPLVKDGVLIFTEGNSHFDDEIQFFKINGHTIAQQILKISDESNTYLFCADLIPTMHHIPIPYIMGYDIQPLETVKEKQKYLHLALEEGWKLIFGHDNFNACASIKMTEKGYSFDRYSNELF